MPLVYNLRKDKVVKKKRRRKKIESKGRQTSLFDQTSEHS
jgi:hypothetical protein